VNSGLLPEEIDILLTELLSNSANSASKSELSVAVIAVPVMVTLPLASLNT
jgi:hypothetical protein